MTTKDNAAAGVAPAATPESLEKMNANLARVEELSQRLVAALSHRKPPNPSLNGPDQELFARAAGAYWQEWMQNPAKIFEHQLEYWGKTVGHFIEAQSQIGRPLATTPATPAPRLEVWRRLFDAVTAEIVSFFSEDPDRGRLLIREALDRPDDMRERLKKHVKPVVVNLSRYLESGQGRGDLWPELDPEAYLFQAIVLFVCGVTLSESFSPLMPASSERGAPQKRLERELLRMAKAAMFTGQARSSVVSGDEVSRGLFGEATKD